MILCFVLFCGSRFGSQVPEDVFGAADGKKKPPATFKVSGAKEASTCVNGALVDAFKVKN